MASAEEDAEQRHKDWLFGTLVVVFGAVWFSPDALLVKLASCSGFDIVLHRMTYFMVSTGVMGYSYALWSAGGSNSEALTMSKDAFVAMGWPFPALGVSIVYCPGIIGFVLSLNYTTAANALVLIGTSPLWSAVISTVVLQEPLRRVTLATLVVSVLCVVGIFIFDDRTEAAGAHPDQWIGDVMALCTSVGIATWFVSIRLGQRYNGGGVLPAAAAIQLRPHHRHLPALLRGAV